MINLINLINLISMISPFAAQYADFIPGSLIKAVPIVISFLARLLISGWHTFQFLLWGVSDLFMFSKMYSIAVIMIITKE